MSGGGLIDAEIGRGQTVDVGYVHVVTEHGGPCVATCPHPVHVEADR